MLSQSLARRDQISMSALPPKADIRPRDQDVRFGPNSDMPAISIPRYLLLDDDRQRERKSRALTGLRVRPRFCRRASQ